MPSSGDEARAGRILGGLREHEKASPASASIARAAESLAARAAAAPAGDRYEIQGVLGEGAASVVYRARDRELGRPVAIKVLKEPLAGGGSARERFVREARIGAGFSHPNVIGVYDVGEEAGRPFLVLELVEGQPLGPALRKEGLDLRARARLVERAARGVGAVHATGVVHRDLKPANILVTADGEPKVGDFGIARVSGDDASLTRTGAILGTPLYMAPEQVQGRISDITPRTDVHALGAILYEAVAGRPPFLGESPTEIYNHIVWDEPEPPRIFNPDIPAELQTICLKALDKEPSRRYSNAAEFAEDLSRFLAGDPIFARSPSMWTVATRRIRRHPVAAAVVGGILVAVLLAAAVLNESSRRAEAEHRVNQLLLPMEAGKRVDEARAEVLRDSAAEVDVDARVAGRVKALAALRSALEILPESADIRYTEAEILEQLGDLDGAQAAWRRSLELGPRDRQARYRIARCMFHQAFFRTAADGRRGYRLDLLEAAAAEVQTPPLTWMNPGQLVDSAMSGIIAALAMKEVASLPVQIDGFLRQIDASGQRRGREELLWIAAMGREDADHERLCGELLAAAPGFVPARVSRGVVRILLGRVDEGIADLEQASRMRPRSAELRLALGRALHSAGKDAARDVEAALELGGPSWPLRAGAEALLKEAKTR